MKAVIGLSFVCCLFSTGYGAEADISLDAILETCEAAQRAVNDVSIEYDYIATPADPKSLTEEAMKAGGSLMKGARHTWLQLVKPFRESYKLRENYISDDMNGKVRDVEVIKSYDGQMAKTYQSQKSGGDILKWGTIARANDSPFYINSTPIGFTIFHEEEVEDSKVDIVQYVRSIRDGDRATLKLNLEICKVNECNSVNLEIWAPVSIGGSVRETLLRRIWFSMDHNYSLVKIEKANATGIVRTYDALELTKLKNGVWFPYKCRLTSDKGIVNTMMVTKVEVNQGIIARDFDVTFPPGTEVSDKIAGKKYTIKPTQEQLDQMLPKK